MVQGMDRGKGKLVGMVQGRLAGKGKLVGMVWGMVWGKSQEYTNHSRGHTMGFLEYSKGRQVGSHQSSRKCYRRMFNALS